MMLILVLTIFGIVLAMITVIKKFLESCESILTNIRYSLLLIPLDILLIEAKAKLLIQNLD